MRNIAAAAAKPSVSLVDLVERFSLVDALDEGAPPGALAYLEMLAQVLEDGILTPAEAADLTEVASLQELSADDVTATNRAFVLALANEALSDGKVSRAERAELVAVAELLDVHAKLVPTFLDHAESARHARLSAGLKALPGGWRHGLPLRVGDRISFTGCEPMERERLERESERLGVRVMSTVSTKTAMLVTDGSMNGGKLAKAHELNARIVHPRDYAELLGHLQPAQTQRTSQATSTVTQSVVIPVLSTQRTYENPELVAASPALVRTWAKTNGWEVGTRGRLPKPLLDAYALAHRPSLDLTTPAAEPTA